MITLKKIFSKIDYHLHHEKGTVYKNHGGKIKVVLIYPNHYKIGMSNLGFQTIYSILNDRQDTVCERAFLPDAEDIQEHKRTGQSLVSYESKTELINFDIIAFSISFENDYPNIIKILNLSNIPIYTSMRQDYHPLLIAGGVCATSNPEPFADVFDVIFIGEAEETINKFLDKYISIGQKSLLKKDILDIEGLYVPELYGTITNKTPILIKKSLFKNFSRLIINPKINNNESEFGHMCLFEVMRGCYWKCRFCLVSSIYNPPRLKDKSLLKNEFSKINTKIGLIAPSLSDVPYITELISRENVRFSITSIRASQKSKTLIQSLKDKKSISIAPEVGTERMRKIINKKIKEEDILSTVNFAFDSGVEILRLYFMIGLPQETYEDLEGIIQLVKKIIKLSKRTKITVTLNPFVPKPFTPFQWHRFEDIKTLKEKINYIKKGLFEINKVSVNDESPRQAFIQSAFARGGRGILEKIISFSLSDNMNIILKDETLKRMVLTSFQYDTPLPWDFIDIGITKSQLWNDYQKAMSI